jgi:hypothetical protein
MPWQIYHGGTACDHPDIDEAQGAACLRRCDVEFTAVVWCCPGCLAQTHQGNILIKVGTYYTP